jgi:hypothetical protein
MKRKFASIAIEFNQCSRNLPYQRQGKRERELRNFSNGLHGLLSNYSQQQQHHNELILLAHKSKRFSPQKITSLQIICHK